MTRARLTALRVVGFKSFAERTTVEFGPGISAIVGPNGSGKSNLADALRWTLGEAGRSLRTRRSEDVIFAGSSTRRATSMADVTLVLDNDDRLLPVDYAEVELGRRLFRSGENEYLLNRQRVRLRDLLELLDVGNLADNAFLFIGQGMVDQALALRPEERRPLFEEAAGVRRHERRRRHAEAELAQAETNIERLRDVLAELRPQARRLAGQAEQLQARRSAGQELAEALVAAARARWVELVATAQHSQAALAAAHTAADTALAELRTAEKTAERLTRELAERAERERAQRGLLDAQRARTVEVRLVLARLASDAAALERDGHRIAAERMAIAQRTAEARLLLAAPEPAADDAALSEELELLDGELRRRAADAPVAGPPPASDAQLATRRVEALRTQLHAAAARLAGLTAEAASAVAEREQAERRLAEAAPADEQAEEQAHAMRTSLEQAVAVETEVRAEVAAVDARVSALRARLDNIQNEVDGLGDGALGRAARARGGRLLAEGLEVEPRFRLAAAAALGDLARGLVVDESEVASLAGGHGTLILRDDGSGVAGERVHDALQGAGGLLSEALRRDPHGRVTRLLERTLWVETLADALAARRLLEPGWHVVTLAGQSVDDRGVVRLAATDRYLVLRDERDVLGATLAEAEEDQQRARRRLQEAGGAREAAASVAREARTRREVARRERRRAEEAERACQRRADTAEREEAWHRRRLDQLRSELAEGEGLLARMSDSAAATADVAGGMAELRRRRDRVVATLAERRAHRRDTEDARRRAEATLAIDEARLAQLEAEAEELAARQSQSSTERERLAGELAVAEAVERRLAGDIERIADEGSVSRSMLIAAEHRAAGARDRLRAAEAQTRAAEVSAMEARLQLEAQREGLLVDLTAIGSQALAALMGGQPPTEPEGDVPSERLTAALDATLARWRADTSPPPAAVGAGRIAALRRRFHELGAGNPFAVEEHAELRGRLEALEAQQRDLELAIRSTRELIDDLNRLIADQFRATFAALEGAFARRFTQLFDGGEAQLSLTAPDDLSATGVEITARPPGKRRQPLQMLSGGERALTAVALLLAMLEVRPVPFCVLDEVDAALDEANIARFAQALRGLAAQTQFIIITHNRGTIEAADALYGVTIGEDAVSRIVSLRLPPPSGESGPAVESGLAEPTATPTEAVA